MHSHARAMSQRPRALEELEMHIDAARDGKRIRCRERHATRQVRQLDAAEIERHAAGRGIA